MDAKSLAKSKRAHSQHHSKKHHPHPPSKGPSASSSTASPSTTKKEIRAKPRQSQGSAALPSNWDRYEDELFDSGTEIPSQQSDIVAPKSKGADYAYLISEAKSQYQTSSSTEIFPSFDDVVSDFHQGMGSFLSVRGQSLLSWIQGDTFVVEDKATTSLEASFLSLDLNALAEQLEKVDLSKRLFMEEDLFPPDLCTGEASQNSGEDQAKSQNIAAKIDSDESPVAGLFDRDKHVGDYRDFTSAVTTSSSHPAEDLTSEVSTDINQVKREVRQYGSAETVPQPAAELNVNVVANPNERRSRFEAEAAEAELDMLLGSFSETKVLDSSGFKEKSSLTSYVSREETSTSSLEGASNQFNYTAPVKKRPELSRSHIAADLDDTLDDLLKDTSSLTIQNGASLSNEAKAAPFDFQSSPFPAPTSKSKLLDDFDSWLDTI